MPITSLYASLLTALMIVLFMRVTVMRGAKQISLLDGGDIALRERMRQHGNFVEMVPMALILMGLAEVNGAVATLHAAGITLIIARILQPIGLNDAVTNSPIRIMGGVATLAVLAGLAVVNLYLTILV